MNVNDQKRDSYALEDLPRHPGESEGVVRSGRTGAADDRFSTALSDEAEVKNKGKGLASEHDRLEAGLSPIRNDDVAALAPSASHVDTVGIDALATIDKAVADLIPHQKATIDEAHKTLADQRTLLHGIMEKGEPTEQAAPGVSWAGRLLGRAPARLQGDEEAAAPLMTFKDAPLALRQNALGARAIVDHIDGAQNEFAAASQRALDRSGGKTGTNSSQAPTSGDRKGAAEDMETAANQYHIQKSRITQSAGKLVGPASTLDVRQSALNTSRAALGVASLGGVATISVGVANALINAHKQG